jgi:hypothetical protein
MVAASFAQPAPQRVRSAPARKRLLVAWLYDLGTLVLALLATGVVGTLWLLARTEWGRVDVALGEAVFAASLVAAAAPAWTAWQWLRLWDQGQTAGHRRLDLDARPSLSGGRRVIELALHPVSVPAWGWLALTLIILEVPGVAWLAVVVTAFVALLGAVSLGLLLVRPAAQPLHRRIARMRLG